MVATLRDLEGSLKSNYFSPPDNLGEGFFGPCLRSCKMGHYYRGAGYFRSSVLQILNKDLIGFCKQGGKMHLLTSTVITREDREAALEGYSLRSLNKTLEEMLQAEDTSLPTRLLCALIASKKLEIHVAKVHSGCLYHDKMGFFEDSQGNTVAFAGSGNETYPALHNKGNFERFTVSCSWDECFPKYGQEWKDFLKDAIDHHLFEGAEIITLDKIDPGLLEEHNIDLDLDYYSQILEEQEINEFGLFDYSKIHPDGPKKHQTDALELWKKNGYRGGLEHATGTYKTATGLMAAAESFSSDLNCVVISTPRMIISDNWLNLARKCFSSSVKVIPCWSDPKHKGWGTEVSDAINSGRKIILVFVNNSLWSEDTGSLLQPLGDNWSLIVDEAHRWEDSRSGQFFERFSPKHRLGLSAEFENPQNPGAMQDVLDYLTLNDGNRMVDRLDLADAINLEFLRNYEYELRPIKIDKFKEGSSDRKTALNILRDFNEEKKTRASSASVDLLLEGKQRVLSYTGSSIDDAATLMQETQLEWNKRSGTPYKFAKITSAENPRKRKEIIDDFNYARTSGLIAIKVLDEGVDLPVADAAVMATSTDDHRQWIQRRGRILRKREITDRSQAKIIDYVLDISSLEPAISRIISELREGDLRRMEEFSGLATSASLNKVKETLSLTGWY